MSEVFKIIKNRWSEVFMIVGLQAGLIYIFLQEFLGGIENPEHVLKRLERIPETRLFGITFGMTAFGVIWYMLYMGFLATAYRFKDQPQPPLKLIAVGRYFFWRMVRFQLLLGLAGSLVSELLKFIPGAVNFAPMLIVLIFIKPIVLCPAIMIVKNCMVFDSLRLMRTYRLSDANQLIRLIVACFGSMFVVSIALSIANLKGTAGTAADITSYVVSGAMGLTVYLGGIVHVASLEPVIEEIEVEIVEEDDEKE